MLKGITEQAKAEAQEREREHEEKLVSLSEQARLEEALILEQRRLKVGFKERQKAEQLAAEALRARITAEKLPREESLRRRGRGIGRRLGPAPSENGI